MISHKRKIQSQMESPRLLPPLLVMEKEQLICNGQLRVTSSAAVGPGRYVSSTTRLHQSGESDTTEEKRK